MAAGAAAGAAAHAAAVANAIKASGVLVRLEAEEFQSLLYRSEAPLVVHSESGLFSTRYNYLTSYRGLAFFARSPRPLRLPAGTELIRAGKIWVPD